MSTADMLDKVKERLGLRTDAGLCRVLEVGPPIVSKLRSGALPMGPMMWLRLHEATGMRTLELKAWAGE